MPHVTHHNSTIALVTFFRQQAPPFNRIDVHDPIALAAGKPLRTSLVSFETSKQLGGPAAGQATITVKGHVTHGINEGWPWAQLLDGGDWWMIDVIKNGTRVGVAYGVIDQVGVSVAAGSLGAGEIVVTVTGRDIGFALDDTPIYFNPFDPSIDNALGMNMLAILDTIAGAPDAIVIGMLKGMMGAPGPDRAVMRPIGDLVDREEALFGGHTTVPAGLAGAGAESHWIDHVDTESGVQTGLRGEVLAAGAISPDGAPAVWQFLDTWRNPCMNELYIDSKPTPYDDATGKKSVVMMREKPFVNSADGLNSPWFKLRTWFVHPSQIVDINVSKGANRVNHVALVGDLLPAVGNDSYGFYPPMADLDSIRTYGLHRLEENTRYSDASVNEFVSDSEDWLYLIISWNCLNHVMWSGSITLGELRPEIRIGQKIALLEPPLGYELMLGTIGEPTPLGTPVDGRLMTFYVERVDHTYSEGESPRASTKLTITNGYKEGERVPDVTEAVAKYKIPLGRGSANTVLGININDLVDDKAIDPGAGVA